MEKEIINYTPDMITTILCENSRAVEKAIKLLKTQSMESKDAKNMEYWNNWIEKGNHLSGDHLLKATLLAIRYRVFLADTANDNQKE